MQIIKIKMADIVPYENNVKLHPKEQIEQIKKSIVDFGNNDPIAVDENNVIIEGHGRFEALKELGYEEAECIVLTGLTEDQKNAYRLVHNKLTMNSDFDMKGLEEELNKIDMDLTAFDFEPFNVDEEEKEIKISLFDKFVIPPFSILDSRQGYWQDRKKMWKKITGSLSTSKEKVLYQSALLAKINDGSSNFDPVLAEIMIKWFNVENGKILDPFGGEQTKGVVVGELGYPYSAVEIRKEQVDIDVEKTKKYNKVKYYLGDSNNISKIIDERDFDFVFTSPPYYDLECYSKEDLSALGTYEEFMKQYKNIFKQCYEMMADNRFLVIKIGEIRNKTTGEYRSFVADNIDMFKDIGFKYYNEIILINPVGTVALTASRNMQTRKVGKVHQNILVFYKGDLKNIKDNFKELDESGVLNDFTEI